MPSEIEILSAQALFVEAFMLEVAVSCALQAPDANVFLRDFITRLHARIDESEATLDEAQAVDMHELARQRVDAFGRDLGRVLNR